ncbi:hypothetical protein DSCA_07150 [Desulfosarcina alkanivorans]|jgi:anti-sigma28 factor (negative regulator of flagellin synthesis)|uniref:Anti-sigma-28 factor FlgM C-terminal domain-containing protein n=1 Tax=Desulfosarcina alkanivorans TaxID=571177 RepID=A0A5K7YEB6_9BACT|nr:flagellar biosynthesis anti-sigma factor FlgM [Desulfosarcina alkanivorans]BBO66785.1 hypothetical protein DSCA_07150 [Desulfosarcina alkanivorans]
MIIPQKGPLQFLPDRRRPAHLSVPCHLRRDNLPASPPGRDTVTLTEKGRDTGSAVQQAKMPGENREDRVAFLRRQIEAGAYRVSGSRIAASMVDETLENNMVLKQIETNG